MSGKQIKLFPVDGTPGGLTTAEITNWTGMFFRRSAVTASTISCSSASGSYTAIVTDWRTYYHEHRPHQVRQQQQAPNDQPDRAVDLAAAILTRPVFAGLITEYDRAA